jgi:uncharacterized protein
MTPAPMVRLLAALCLLLPLLAGAAPAGVLPLSAFPREQIAIETRSSFRRLLFEAWRADTMQARAQGLMFVEDAAVRPDQAMIFVYERPQVVSMWMKNTVLPLDMLFVDEHGCVVNVRERAQPGSLANISSGVPVVLVVELKAGTVARHGLQYGDRVVRLDAGWPDETVACRSAS